MTRKLFLIFALLLCSISVHATEIVVHGTVMEMGTRRPMADVLISVQTRTGLSASSDSLGKFELHLPAAGSYELHATDASSGASATQTLTIADDSTSPVLTFYLRPIQKLAAVVVTAERSPDRVSKSALSGNMIRSLPGTSGDPLRALQTLPGVVGVEGTSAPAVRGTGPEDNLYYVDGLYVDKLFHLGSLSVFNADLIQDFNLYSAAFAPHYGDVTGAVIDVALRNPRKDRFGTKLQADFMGASVLAEGPRGSNESYYFAARRSYIDLLIKQVEQDGVTVQIPEYWDYQGKYLWQLNDNNRLTMHLHGAADRISFNVSSTSDTGQMDPVLVGTSAHSDGSATQGLVLDSTISGKAFNTLTLEHASNHSEMVVGTAGTVNLKRNLLVLREQLTLDFNPSHQLLLSNEFLNSRVKVAADIQNPTCTEFNPDCDVSTSPRLQLYDDLNANAWSMSAQDRKRVAQDLTLSAGLRHSVENYAKRSYNEPRVGAEWDWSPATLLTAGWGKHNQNPPDQQWVRVFGNPDLDHLHAEHSVLGVKHKVDDVWNWKTETYYKKLSNLVINDPSLNYINGASGQAWGFELLIRKEENDERLSGWLVLDLARSQRKNDVTGESFRYQYDQPINAKLVAKYKMSDQLSLGAKWEYHSGTPYTPIVGTSGTYPDGRPIPVYAGVNSGTMPPYHRLDLRLDRHFTYDTWKLNTYFELNNAYFRKNIIGYSYNPDYTSRKPVESFVLPFSFGVEAEF